MEMMRADVMNQEPMAKVDAKAVTKYLRRVL